MELTEAGRPEEKADDLGGRLRGEEMRGPLVHLALALEHEQLGEGGDGLEVESDGPADVTDWKMNCCLLKDISKI